MMVGCVSGRLFSFFGATTAQTPPYIFSFVAIYCHFLARVHIYVRINRTKKSTSKRANGIFFRLQARQASFILIRPLLLF
jgi:hypothetical protein